MGVGRAFRRVEGRREPGAGRRGIRSKRASEENALKSQAIGCEGKEDERGGGGGGAGGRKGKESDGKKGNGRRVKSKDGDRAEVCANIHFSTFYQ